MHTPYSEIRFVLELGNTLADQRISRIYYLHIKHVIILLRVCGAYNVDVSLNRLVAKNIKSLIPSLFCLQLLFFLV